MIKEEEIRKAAVARKFAANLFIHRRRSSIRLRVVPLSLSPPFVTRKKTVIFGAAIFFSLRFLTYVEGLLEVYDLDGRSKLWADVKFLGVCTEMNVV